MAKVEIEIKFDMEEKDERTLVLKFDTESERNIIRDYIRTLEDP